MCEDCLFLILAFFITIVMFSRFYLSQGLITAHHRRHDVNSQASVMRHFGAKLIHDFGESLNETPITVEQTIKGFS